MSKTRILVIDDDPKLSNLVRLFLESTGRYEVLQENRPANALAAAKAFDPAMILLDVDMPGKDGGEVALELQGDKQTKKCPVVFFTSLIAQSEAGKHDVVRGGSRFLSKPVHPSVLMSTIERVLSETEAAA